MTDDTPPIDLPRHGAAVRAALKDLGLRPSRKRGQSFLCEAKTAARIVAAADPQPVDRVLEIGPGLGALTGPLVASGAPLLLCEVEAALAAFLRERLAGRPAVTVLAADATDGHGGLSRQLDQALAALGEPDSGGRRLVVSNLPYAAGTAILAALLDRDPPPDTLVVMVQKEVAERIAAGPGTRARGPLSVLVQAVARVHRCFNVGPRAFHPVPAVASSVLRVDVDPARWVAAGDRDRLRRLVHGAFGLRRKTLANALGKAGLASAADLVAAGVDPTLRAEALTTEQFVALAHALPSLASDGGSGEDRVPSR